MHILQPKHVKLNPEEADKILKMYNISLAQLPKISSKDPAIPQDCKKGDIIKIQREGDRPEVYFRVVI